MITACGTLSSLASEVSWSRKRLATRRATDWDRHSLALSGFAPDKSGADTP